jgi:hypothetical protein
MFLTKQICAIAPIYLHHWKRVDKLRYKQARGRIEYIEKVWMYVPRHKRLSICMRYLKYNIHRDNIGSMQARTQAFILKLFFIISNTWGWSIGSNGWNNYITRR